MKEINIALVPARSGSKRIKNKNIKYFFSKPMISRTLENIKKIKYFNKIAVSSDSNKILNIAKKSSVDFLIKRKKNLSNDKSPIDDVIRHAVNFLEKKKNYKIKTVACFFPCNPFLQKKDFLKALKILKQNPNHFIMTINKFKHPIERSYVLKKNKFIFFSNLKNQNRMTQTFETKYHDAGQFYLATPETWFQKNKKKIGIIIPIWRSVDIDDEEDWITAKYLFNSINSWKKKY